MTGAPAKTIPPLTPGQEKIKNAIAAKKKKMARVLEEVNTEFGKNTIIYLGETPPIKIGNAFSTGVLSLDLALGPGGIPRGRVIELYGPEGAGKTTLALSTIAYAQKEGGLCAYIDAEHGMDTNYTQAMGVNLDDLLITQPENGEQALNVLLKEIEGGIDLAVVDSVAALVPQAELEGDIGDAHIGLQARLMGQAMRKLSNTLAKHNASVIFINQLRDKVGVMFGSSEITPGGRALKFFASIRLDIRRVEGITVKSEVVGNRIKVKAVKNKVAPPFREAQFDLIFGKGPDTTKDIIETGVKYGVIVKSGSWYSYKNHKFPLSSPDTLEIFKSHPDLEQGIREEVFKIVSTPQKSTQFQVQTEKKVTTPSAKAGGF
jgi:recombination protein RecA